MQTNGEKVKRFKVAPYYNTGTKRIEYHVHAITTTGKYTVKCFTDRQPLNYTDHEKAKDKVAELTSEL